MSTAQNGAKSTSDVRRASTVTIEWGVDRSAGARRGRGGGDGGDREAARQQLSPETRPQRAESTPTA